MISLSVPTSAALSLSLSAPCVSPAQNRSDTCWKVNDAEGGRDAEGAAKMAKSDREMAKSPSSGWEEEERRTTLLWHQRDVLG